MYTLETHLESFQEDEFKILNAIWKLNKKNLPQAQSAISFNFPHYSLHEKTHSDTIVRNIESYLGQRVKDLSPTDTWLILMAAHTHDLGMIIFSKTIEKVWSGDSFIEYLNDITTSSVDEDLVAAAHLIIQLTEDKSNSKELINLVLGIRKALILLVSDYFRSIHHTSSRRMIMREDREFSDMVSGLSMENLPNRFTNTLADIAYCHGINFYDVLKILENEADGIGNDKMHPRFVACLLRLGDLLDVDDKRFSNFNEKVVDTLPAASQLHKDKHASIRHLLISPKGIEITADCRSEEVYRIARQWFDWLEREVEHQTKEWALIAPSEFPGLPPMISRGKIKVLYKSEVVDNDLMNLRFHISNKRIFEIIEGQALYEDVGLVFIRELVQNALDASNIQMWKMIKEGIYDELIRNNPDFEIDEEKEIAAQIRFPFHIPPEIYWAFRVEMNIYWSSPAQEELVIEVCDSGTGISKADLLRMTSKVGENKNTDCNGKHAISAMPYFLQPTGAFGIGLQSVFYVANSFQAITKSEGEKEKEIVFRSAKRGEYCTMAEYNGKNKRGSKFTVRLKRQVLDTLMSVDHDAENEEDFEEDQGHLFIPYLERYLQTEFSKTKLLTISFFGKTIKQCFYAKDNEDELSKIKLSIPIHKDQVSCFISKSERFHEAVVFENIFGSEIKLRFFSKFSDQQGFHPVIYSSESNYMIRDIPVGIRFGRFSRFYFATIVWNLQNVSSDKLLNISRDKFIKKKKEEIDNVFAKKLLPIVLTAIRECFTANYPNESKVSDSFAIEYFHVLLMYEMVPLDSTPYRPPFFSEKTIPLKLAMSIDGAMVTFADFFTTDYLLGIFVEELLESNTKYTSAELWEQIRNTYGEWKGGVVLFEFSYFFLYFFKRGFTIVKYNILDISGYQITVVVYKQESKFVKLVVENEQKANILIENLETIGRGRTRILPFEPYASVIGIAKTTNENVNGVIFSSNALIISPFRNGNDIKMITSLTEQKGQTVDVIMGSDIFNEMVPPSLIKYVKENSAFDENQSDQDIKKMYATLILDYIMAVSSIDSKDEE